MKISVKPELSHIISWNEVLCKKDKFIISDINYNTLINIIKISNPNFYSELLNLDQEKIKFAINSIISENKNLGPEKIINYICSLNKDQLESLGNTYYEIISNFLLTSNFQTKDNKGIIFIDSNLIDFEFIFRNFPDIEVLFIFNKETQNLTLIDRDLHVLNKFKQKRESDIYDIFETYTKKELKKNKDSYYNNLMNKLLMDYFSTDTFMSNFLDEVFFKLSNLIMMADKFEIDERNMKILIEHYKDLCKDKKVENALIKILSNKRPSKYTEVENIK